MNSNTGQLYPDMASALADLKPHEKPEDIVEVHGSAQHESPTLPPAMSRPTSGVTASLGAVSSASPGQRSSPWYSALRGWRWGSSRRHSSAGLSASMCKPSAKPNGRKDSDSGGSAMPADPTTSAARHQTFRTNDGARCFTDCPECARLLEAERGAETAIRRDMEREWMEQVDAD